MIHLLVLVRMLLASALDIEVLRIFLVSQVETSSIRHMHFEGTRGETLGLLLVDTSNLFFRVANRSIMFLWILLHELILKKLLIILELLPITRNS